MPFACSFFRTTRGLLCRGGKALRGEVPVDNLPEAFDVLRPIVAVTSTPAPTDNHSARKWRRFIEDSSHRRCIACNYRPSRIGILMLQTLPAQRRLPLPPVMPSSEPAKQERQYRDNQEDDEKDFRHSHEGTCNSSEAEQCSDQRDDETSDC